MLKLSKVTIHKYKCIESDQEFDVSDDITVLVGMNESGKTSVLEAIAKTNYLDDSDDSFKFKATHDYPRREKKKMEKSGQKAKAVTCAFKVNEALLKTISSDVGEGTFTKAEVSKTFHYTGNDTWLNTNINQKKFAAAKTKGLGISSKALNDKLEKVRSKEDLDALIETYTEDKIKEGLESLRPYFENEWNWETDALAEYIYRNHLSPRLPKFLYYDEYYALPSRISVEDLEQGNINEAELKTAKALFELADINTEELVESTDFEDYKAELEATQASITEELFKYWSTNKNLDIQFDIDKVEASTKSKNAQGQVVNNSIVKHVLDIRIRNNTTKVSLPLKNRSKGFNWFFSFLVWFKKIQEDKNSNYVFLLDEPGLNLHASAQADLLSFIEDLSEDYQIIYTTHSPFMVDSNRLERVRTVVEKRTGSTISTSVQEKDPNTLFPLQAALGYSIAQNLFISKHNLLVEGVSDLVYLQVVSSILEADGRTSLDPSITIVPVGGLDKVGTFISLLRGSELGIGCLLDSSIDQSNQAKLDNLVRQKIIANNKIRYYDKYVSASEADVEDLFSKDEYVALFNVAFPEHNSFTVADLNTSLERVIAQINAHLSIQRFNHYRPANHFAKNRDSFTLCSHTLDTFEQVFTDVNRLFVNGN